MNFSQASVKAQRNVVERSFYGGLVPTTPCVVGTVQEILLNHLILVNINIQTVNVIQKGNIMCKGKKNIYKAAHALSLVVIGIFAVPAVICFAVLWGVMGVTDKLLDSLGGGRYEGD